MRHAYLLVLFCLLLCSSVYASNQRIISLAPNITEILFAIGAGENIVGTSVDSTYPAAAKKIPIVDNAGQLDLEAIVAAKPTLIVAWRGGNPRAQLQSLRQLKIPVVSLSFNTIQDIPKAMLKLGKLTGHLTQAQAQAKLFNKKLLKLKQTKKHSVKVFYILWQHPLITVGKGGLINQAIEFCGGQNIFADIHSPAPQVGMAAVLQRNPQVIISGIKNTDWQKFWQEWPQINAVKTGRLDYINPNLLQRPGPRFIYGLAELCQKLS